MRIALNQPRASYFVGGSEVVSIEHAIALVESGEDVTYYTIEPNSIGIPPSDKYTKFKADYSSKHNLKINELAQDKRAVSVYSIKPGENKDRWYVESMFYNRVLFEAIDNPENGPFDILLSYYQFDALCVPTQKITFNALYLCGIPSTENVIRSSQLQMYDKIIAITNEVGDYWQKYDLRPIPTIPTGVRPYTPPTAPHKPLNKFSIVFAGRLIERKGCADLINAVGALSPGLKQLCSVKILGKGPQRDTLEQIVESEGLDSVVQFIGLVNNPMDYFALSDICVFPSLRGEGLMGVVLEAMSTSACVVATRHNGNDILLDDNRGVLFEPGDVTQLANIIEILAHDKTLRTTKGNLARKYVEENHDWKRIATDLVREVLR